MATTVKLLALRDYSEHDVVPFYGYSGSIPANAGTIVKIGGSGYAFGTSNTKFLGDVGAAYQNVNSQRFGVTPYTEDCGSGDLPVGMLLFDIREYDENGEKLIFKPRKAAEMQVAISGQAVPFVTRGVFVYSGVHGTVTPGVSLYVSGGVLTATPIGGGTVVAQALSSKDNRNATLIRLKL